MVTRKRLASLTPQDFERQRYWDVLEGDDDDPWVQPFDPPRRDRTNYLVSASATLADGTTCSAFVRVAHLGPIVELGPVTVFHKGSQVPIGASDPGFLYAVRDKAELSLLPLHWVLSVPLDGEAKLRKGSANASRLIRFFKVLAWQSRLQRAQRSMRSD